MCQHCDYQTSETDSPALASAKRTLSELQTQQADISARLDDASERDDDEAAAIYRAQLLEIASPLREIRRALAKIRLPLLSRKFETYSELLEMVRADLTKTQRDLQV